MVAHPSDQVCRIKRVEWSGVLSACSPRNHVDVVQHVGSELSSFAKDAATRLGFETDNGGQAGHVVSGGLASSAGDQFDALLRSDQVPLVVGHATKKLEVGVPAPTRTTMGHSL